MAGTIIIHSPEVVRYETMHRREHSHLDEWATLLEAEVADELLEEESDALVFDDSADRQLSGDEAR